MLTEYIKRALSKAKYKKLEDGTYCKVRQLGFTGPDRAGAGPPSTKAKLSAMLFGVLAHDLYHTGQIVLLRQMQGVEL